MLLFSLQHTFALVGFTITFQVTPDGKPKIIDFIDASGCGDVKMRTKFRLSEDDRTVETLTGRQVKVSFHCILQFTFPMVFIKYYVVQDFLLIISRKE